MEARWETSPSKSALPGSSPCWRQPPANLFGPLWVNISSSQTQIGLTSSVWQEVSTLDSCILSLFPLTAVQNSAKGSYRDKRNQVVYSEDFLWAKRRATLEICKNQRISFVCIFYIAFCVVDCLLARYGTMCQFWVDATFHSWPGCVMAMTTWKEMWWLAWWPGLALVTRGFIVLGSSINHFNTFVHLVVLLWIKGAN